MPDKLIPSEREALFHWSLYGQKSEPTNCRVQASECRPKRIVTPITSPWNQPISRADLPKLLNGFASQQMEDKWDVYADGPDEQGRATVHMLRSWTGHKMVELKLQVPVDEGDARITEIVWESHQERYRGGTEEKAKTMAREVCRWCLNVALPE